MNFRPKLSSQGFKSVPELMSTATRIGPPPELTVGSHASNPVSLSHSASSSEDMNFRPQSGSQKFKLVSELMSTATRVGSAPAPDESHSSSSESWAPTETHSGSTNSWPPQRHVSPPASSPGSSQDRVPSPLNLGDHLPSDSHSWSSGSTTEEEEHYPSSQDQSSTEESRLSSPGQPSTDESHPPTPGPTDNHPPPTLPSNPGPSTATEPNPPPSAKRPRPEEHDAGSFLTKIFKGKLKRRFSGSGALNAARGGLQPRVPLTLRRTSLRLPSLTCQQTTVVMNILTF
jgi:hypothetical protein